VKSLLPLPEFESSFLWCPSRSFVTILSKLSRFLVVGLSGNNKRVLPLKYEVLLFLFIALTKFPQ
jgi:hypothetical protein